MSSAVVHAQRVQTFDTFGGIDPTGLGLFEVVFQIGFFEGVWPADLMPPDALALMLGWSIYSEENWIGEALSLQTHN